jgi:hypothetical protein
VKLVITLAILFAFTQASFADDCWLGQESQLVVVDWSAEENEDGWTQVTISIKNNFNKDLKSSVARALFSSSKGPFDRGVGAPIFPQQVAAGQTQTIEFATDATEYRQLIGAINDNYRLRICLQAASFQDGTEERFRSPLSNQ